MVHDRPMVAMDHYAEVIGSQSIYVGDFERRKARGQFLFVWRISVMTLVPFDLEQPDLAR